MRKIVAIATLIIVVVLLILVVFLIKARSPFGKSNSEFSSKPANEITRIEFFQSEEKLALEKKGDDWLINGNSKARKGGINFIIRILTEAKIKSPVSSEMYKCEITGKNITPVLVRVYEGRKLLKSFRVYKTSSNVYGNIMKMSESAKPFIVHVPGHEVNIGAAFTLNERYWQPYTIFNLLPSEINSIRFENLSDTASSFTIAGKNGQYSLSGASGELTGWDSSLVVRYISYFTFIPFEAWAMDMTGEEKLSLEQQPPAYRITVISSEGSVASLGLWQKTRIENGEQVIDTDRLLGKTRSGDEFFIVRYFDIDPVLKKRSYFFTD